jgi:hypothetical protein
LVNIIIVRAFPHRDTNTHGNRETQRERCAYPPDFARLLDHLHLLLVVAVVPDLGGVAEQVERVLQWREREREREGSDASEHARVGW